MKTPNDSPAGWPPDPASIDSLPGDVRNLLLSHLRNPDNDDAAKALERGVFEHLRSDAERARRFGDKIATIGSWVEASICADCVDDSGIKRFIAESAAVLECTLCGKETEESLAVWMSDLRDHVLECLEAHYDDPADCLPYESAEGGYQLATVLTTSQIIRKEFNVLFDFGDPLIAALDELLPDRVWCERDPLRLNEHERLRFSWLEFCTLVKHHRRFFFLNGIAEENDDEDDEILKPGQLLEEIGKSCDELALITTLPQTAKLFRVRRCQRGWKFTTASEVRPPPSDRAVQANRMSPAGIVMFYSSEDPETAIRETAPSGWHVRDRRV
jgi:hypothetical protein